MPAVRGARPIKNKEVSDFHFHIDKNSLKIPTLDEYQTIWREWINYSDCKSLQGLDAFTFADYTQGTSQAFDQFILRHSKDRQIIVLDGDFQYHACLGKHLDFKWIPYPHYLEEHLDGLGLHALIISAPFSDFGSIHSDFEHIMEVCNVHDVPVCLDLAYWGISKNMHINLNDFPAIKEVTSGKMSRRMLSEDDPNYLTSEQYSKVSPAKRNISTTQEEPLWKERFPLDELKRRERLNPREFASLYQQMPYVEGGNLIKTEWWQKFPEGLTPENFTSLVIGVDTAFKKTETADYSAAVVAGMDRNGDMYIIEIVRGKYDFPELKQRLIRLNNKWRGKGLRGLYIEDKASGQSIIQELKRESGISIIPYKVVHDKVARVNAILPLIEGGRVYLPQTADWLDSFIDETVQFPSANHDDQVDAMTIALDTLSRTHVGSEAWELQGSMSSLNNVSRETLGKSLLDTATKIKSKWTGWGLPSN